MEEAASLSFNTFRGAAANKADANGAEKKPEGPEGGKGPGGTLTLPGLVGPAGPLDDLNTPVPISADGSFSFFKSDLEIIIEPLPKAGTTALQ